MRLNARRLASLAGIVLIGAAGTAAAQQIGQDKAGKTFILPPGFPAGSTVQRATEGGVYITPPGGMTQHLPGGKVTPFDNSVLRFQKAEPFPRQFSDPTRYPISGPLSGEDLAGAVSGRGLYKQTIKDLKKGIAVATKYSDGSISVHTFRQGKKDESDPNRNDSTAYTTTFLPDGTRVDHFDDLFQGFEQMSIDITLPNGVTQSYMRERHILGKPTRNDVLNPYLLDINQATTETTSTHDGGKSVHGITTRYDRNDRPIGTERYSYRVEFDPEDPSNAFSEYRKYVRDGATYTGTGGFIGSYHLEYNYGETTRIDYGADGKPISSFHYSQYGGTSITIFNADGSSVTTQYDNGVKTGESKGTAPSTPPAPNLPKQAPTVKPITPPTPKGTRVSSGPAIVGGAAGVDGSFGLIGVPLNTVPEELRYITPPSPTASPNVGQNETPGAFPPPGPGATSILEDEPSRIIVLPPGSKLPESPTPTPPPAPNPNRDQASTPSPIPPSGPGVAPPGPGEPFRIIVLPQPPRDTRYTVAGVKARLAKLKKRLEDPKLTDGQRTAIQSQIDGIERFSVVHGTEANAAGMPTPRP